MPVAVETNSVADIAIAQISEDLGVRPQRNYTKESARAHARIFEEHAGYLTAENSEMFSWKRSERIHQPASESRSVRHAANETTLDIGFSRKPGTNGPETKHGLIVATLIDVPGFDEQLGFSLQLLTNKGYSADPLKAFQLVTEFTVKMPRVPVFEGFSIDGGSLSTISLVGSESAHREAELQKFFSFGGQILGGISQADVIDPSHKYTPTPSNNFP